MAARLDRSRMFCGTTNACCKPFWYDPDPDLPTIEGCRGASAVPMMELFSGNGVLCCWGFPIGRPGSPPRSGVALFTHAKSQCLTVKKAEDLVDDVERLNSRPP